MIKEKECPICHKIIKNCGVSSLSFEELFKRHIKRHRLLKGTLAGDEDKNGEQNGK